jgi:molybdopterin converting factor small subunit
MKILYFGYVKERLLTGEETVAISGQTTIAEFLARHVAPRLGPEYISKISCAVNGDFAPADAKITDSDVLAVLPPFSGG